VILWKFNGCSKKTIDSTLVGGFNTLKNMKVDWDDDIPNTWKVIKTMFQTTNQNIIQR